MENIQYQSNNIKMEEDWNKEEIVIKFEEEEVCETDIYQDENLKRLFGKALGVVADISSSRSKVLKLSQAAEGETSDRNDEKNNHLMENTLADSLCHITSHETARSNHQNEIKGKSFTQTYGHSILKITEESLKCDICGEFFSRKSHLEQHRKEKPFSCGTCGKCFKVKQNFGTHRKLFKCDICAEYFTCKCALNIHVRCVHEMGKTYQCNICGKWFTEKSNLDKHLLTHSEKSSFKCNICGKSFTCKTLLKSHRPIHFREKPFKCITCGKCFTHKSSLDRHCIIHRRVPFKCNTCEKFFAQETNLNSHICIHIGEKPYTCVTCGKCFTQQDLLYGHQFKCKAFGKSFSQKDQLHDHHVGMCNGRNSRSHVLFKKASDVFTDISTSRMKLLHTAESFKCNTCGKSFIQKDQLDGHVDMMHNGRNPHSKVLFIKASGVITDISASRKKLLRLSQTAEEQNDKTYKQYLFNPCQKHPLVNHVH